MKNQIKIIDLFAGPGGLGEGFSALETENGDFPFQIAASVEMEPSAHKTLTLRAFFRQFRGKEVPKEYYDYVRSGGRGDLDEVFSEYLEQLQAAKDETLGGPKALGSEDHDEIFQAIEDALKNHKGPTVVIGGPPCQAYSLVGRARNKGNKSYQPEEDARHFLYQEYLKVLDLVNPDVFVMENVKGILTAKVNGNPIFEEIQKDLRHPGKAVGNHGSDVEYDLYPLAVEIGKGRAKYSGKDFVIRAEEFGIPQARHRVIILGVRRDHQHKVPSSRLLGQWQTNELITADQVLYDLPSLRSGQTKVLKNDYQAWLDNLKKAEGHASLTPALRNAAKKYAREAGSRPSVDPGQGLPFVEQAEKNLQRMPEALQKWYLDKELEGVPNHQARNHMPEDLHRYFYASCYAEINEGLSPRSADYPDELAPAHKNWKSGHFADRFKVQSRHRVASTVTSHISKDGHYFIHYDPAQCRSLTVREAARIQTFPDNYFFEGNRTQQYVQVGNAVPPLLANRIAQVVLSLLCDRSHKIM
ncbi:DNA cytosine methyltransferase [Marinobacter xiaoshiensis]|uniref:DNA (cytosine-5-)-methyltransferase n=1 Tax=Marinobacter xiaoshiensis TaxID=3073652 RepID=A0ABU2HE40_9GAMM|nr:DNA cytosine methyltransferase [Marinobacter sp. F60267]MDS1308885.1 DNA cytosine methyltransferase [Marinobacter sp. F60267]